MCASSPSSSRSSYATTTTKTGGGGGGGQERGTEDTDVDDVTEYLSKNVSERKWEL
jgi:hypothetical protein